MKRICPECEAGVSEILTRAESELKESRDLLVRAEAKFAESRSALLKSVILSFLGACFFFGVVIFDIFFRE